MRAPDPHNSVASMETDPDKIIVNILDDMAEIGDSTSISDATTANGKNSFHATREDVVAILTAIKNNQAIIPGRLTGGFQDLPADWDPTTVTNGIFSDPNPVGAMMDVLLRPAGEWPKRQDNRIT